MASIIKTDNIQKVSDDSNIIKKCGSTTTVGSGAGNTITVDGATITLGRCGGTVSLASGATQTGFGRTGTVDWCSTAKTSPFTAVSGDGYFVNTSGGAVTVTLPASPSAGDIVSIADYASTFQTNNVTVGRNGSKINAACTDAFLSTQGQSVTLIYVDATRGWKSVQDSTSDVTGAPAYIIACGGNTTITDGDYKIHVFTSAGTFNVTGAGIAPNNVLDYFVVGGAGGTGGFAAGGGGAGGFRGSSSTYTEPNPLMACVAGLTASVASFPITVGAGGAGGPSGPGGYCGTNKRGSNSIFSTITSAGGGGGGTDCQPGFTCTAAQAGGSGGGQGRCTSNGPAGAGNTPPVAPPQGNTGGNGANGSPYYSGGGGGGAAGAGTNGTGSSLGSGGAGGPIALDAFLGPTYTSYGEANPPAPTTRLFSGGGAGGGANSVGSSDGVSGAVNTGKGGGGARQNPTSGPDIRAGGAGGSGIVMIRYKFQN